ncbi:hypothetical protein [Paenibacillus xylanilyticus]|uniref:DUF4134 domain-containing protein n=1 Tax=Paenibacillus xylanilyticus TaxID=248903 RepID=A0A7Y6BUQ1_9BACL|nr:hypothetical protein [Paenibacillus xylanilyticus]NUU75345.1 hypothetical protein [Paenibacillus xylanilyticus]
MKNLFMSMIKKPMAAKVLSLSFALMLMTTRIYAAAEGMDQFDGVVEVIATWAGRIGLVVAFFGGIQTALGFKQDDADGKVRGMKTMAAGFMVFGISKSLSLFGL